MLSKKFIEKYMRLAWQMGMDHNPCYSRKIGVIIVGKNNRILATGYNGPPAGTPHCTSADYLREFYWPQLTDDEKESFRLEFGVGKDEVLDHFVREYAGKKTCPRRWIRAKSGERVELCSCQHAERNAITNAACDLHGSVMFAWCGLPCLQCAGAIINAGITELHCLADEDYHPQSNYLFNRAGISVMRHPAAELSI